MTMTMMTMIIITKMMMIIGSLNNDDVEDNENAEKANRFSLTNLKKISLHVDNVLLYISLVSFHDLPNFTFLDKRFYFFSTQIQFFRIEHPKNSPTFDKSRLGKRAMNFETA